MGGDVPMAGLSIREDLVENNDTREPLHCDVVGKIIGGMLNRGMLIVPCGRFGDVFRFMPPLVLTREYALEAVDIVLEAPREVM